MRLRQVVAAVVLCGAVAGLGTSASQAATCNVMPQGTSFGSYDALRAAPLDGVGDIAVRCDTSVSFTVALSTGRGSYAERRMAGGTKDLIYNLYTDASRLIVWGDGSGGTGTVSSVGASVDLPVYGQIPAGQTVPATAYSDTIVVTISF